MEKKFFGDFKDLETVFIPEPAMDRQMFYGDNLMVGINAIKPGVTIPMHAHKEEQISYVLSGECDIIIDGPDGRETKHAGPGEAAWFPANVPHEVTAGPEGATVMDIFDSLRQDWLALFEK